METLWKKCNSCKKEIAFKSKYWVCNVSTCNRKRTGLVFCSVSCWDAHVPMMNHRESWAEERTAPTQEQWARIQAGAEDLPGTKPRQKEEKPAEEPKKPPSTAPRTILRKSSGGTPT